MITAIIQIVALLLVAGLIVFFFTRRYWKQLLEAARQSHEDEMGAMQEKQQQLQADLKAANTVLDQQKEEVNRLQNEQKEELKHLQDEHKEETKRLQDQQKEEVKRLQDQLARADKKEQQQSAQSKSDMVSREELEAHIREIEALNAELSKSKGSYYKQIDGERYKAVTLKMADEAVAGRGDGRISKEDAEKIFDTISDGQAYTPVEKNTMHYLRENYNWTPEADELFRTKVRSWAAKGHHLE